MPYAASVPASARPLAATPGAAGAGYFVFISYSAKDKEVADTICRIVEAAGVRCWIAPRDVQPGREWRPSIIEAIEHCHVMVLVFSDDANRSSQVSREVEVAFDEGKTIIPFRIQNTEMNKSLRYCISSTHWLDALTPPLSEHADRLVATLVRLMDEASGARAASGAGVGTAASPPAPRPSLSLPAAPAPAAAATPDRLAAIRAAVGAGDGEDGSSRAGPVGAHGAGAEPPTAGARSARGGGPRPARTLANAAGARRAVVAAAVAGMAVLPAAVWAIGARAGRDAPAVEPAPASASAVSDLAVPEPQPSGAAPVVAASRPAAAAASHGGAGRQAPGRIHIGGELPPGTVVTATGVDGRSRRAQAGVLTLAPGRYQVNAEAQEYTPVVATVDVLPGSTSILPLRLTRIPAVPAEPAAAPSAPAPGGAADAAAIQDAVRGFAAVLESRDAARIEAAYPAAAGWLSSASDFLATVRRLRVRVAGMGTPEVEADAAHLTFTARLEWDDAAGTGQNDQVRFAASLRREGGRWVITRLDAR